MQRRYADERGRWSEEPDGARWRVDSVVARSAQVHNTVYRLHEGQWQEVDATRLPGAVRGWVWQAGRRIVGGRELAAFRGIAALDEAIARACLGGLTVLDASGAPIDPLMGGHDFLLDVSEAARFEERVRAAKGQFIPWLDTRMPAAVERLRVAHAQITGTLEELRALRPPRRATGRGRPSVPPAQAQALHDRLFAAWLLRDGVQVTMPDPAQAQEWPRLAEQFAQGAQAQALMRACDDAFAAAQAEQALLVASGAERLRAPVAAALQALAQAWDDAGVEHRFDDDGLVVPVTGGEVRIDATGVRATAT